MTKRLTTSIATLIVIVVIVAGCGGGGGGSTSTSAAEAGNSGSTASESSGSGSGNSESSGSESNSAESGNSESSGSTAQGSSLSKAEFVEQASAACNEERESLVEELEAYFKHHESDGIPEPVLIANMVRTVILPTVEAEIGAVRAIGAPAGEEQQVEAILAAQQATVDKVKQQKSFKTLEESEAYFRPVSAKMRAYGFTACTNSTR